MIDWHNFTPWASLLGGMLIGIATAILILFNGRIAGISGILGGLVKPRMDDVDWRLAFVLGLLLSSIVWDVFLPTQPPLIETNNTTIIVAGLLVGIGTRFGSGCTSGHGICGLSRASPRSIVATLTFMLVGFITVYIVRHLVVA